MKPIRLLPFALSLLCVGAFGQVDPARVVATVNGEEIKGQEYYHRMEFMPGVGRRTGSQFIEFPPGFLAIEELVTERLLLQLAKDRGVTPTDAEIQSEINNRAAEDPKFIENWLSTGQNRADLDDQIRIELAQFKLQTQGITITDQEVDDYYNHNPNFFTTPRLYKLRTIVVTSLDSKKPVDDALASGKLFADVAKAYSEDVTKAAGGDFGEIAINQVPDGSREAILAAKIGETTGWVALQNTFAKFLVENIKPERKIDLTPALRRQIRRQQMLERGSQKNDLAKDMAAMRTKSKVDIKEKAFADAYARFVENYLKSATAPRG